MTDPDQAPESKSSKRSDVAKTHEGVAGGVAAAIQEYEEVLSRHGGSSCDRFILMALRNQNVVQSITEHIAGGKFFVGVYCPSIPGIPEEARVVFEFQCLPPKICILPNLFLVVLNAFTGRVLRIIDPYYPGFEQQLPTATESDTAREVSPAAQHPSLAAHHPSLAAHHPSLAAHHPSLAAHHPSLAAHHPSLAAHHPSLAAHHPSLAAHHPSLAAHHPSLAAHHPSLAAHHPSLAAHHPSLAAHHPSLAAHHPSLAAHHPSLAAHHPSLAGE
ncbi:hypothetical protein [Sinorhizobium meliloti]|uniref:hypothetical protein n=1 Tax=Rhizobium meliloti TaxID=382 RepID=UPI0020C03D48|nr:hypothetical protein [Sinorhizobium meliloti]